MAHAYSVPIDETYSGSITQSQLLASTCFRSAGEGAEAGLILPGAELQFDGERLASSHNEALHAVQICAVVCVVELTLQIPGNNVQS